jgi:hypothetical protein
MAFGGDMNTRMFAIAMIALLMKGTEMSGGSHSALVAASVLGSATAAQSLDQPATVTPDGSGPISRAGQARRAHLLGVVQLYTVALYVDEPLFDRAHLISPDVTKALRIVVTYREDLHRRVALDWRKELIPRLDLAATAHLRGTFAPLKEGDVVQIEYVPTKGTVVRVNRAVAVSGANHDLMLAFLDHWLGQRPVSETIKRTLLGGS